MFRQKIDQSAGNFPGFTKSAYQNLDKSWKIRGLRRGGPGFERRSKCAGASGKFRNEPCQLFDRLTVAKRREPACFLPRVEAEARQGRHHVQRYSFDLVADRRKQKLVKIGPQWTEGLAQCHRAQAGAGSIRSCPEAILAPSVLGSSY